jgi:hypothetical protein
LGVWWDLGECGGCGCAAFSAFPPSILKRKKKATTTTATGSRDMTIVKKPAGILKAISRETLIDTH